jgi:hypothetical protein
MAKAAARELRTQIQISSFDQKSVLRLVTLCSVCNEYFFQLDAELPIGDLRLAIALTVQMPFTRPITYTDSINNAEII